MDLDLEAIYCVNCGSASGSIILENEQILHCIQQWTAPRLVQADDLICTICLTEARSIINYNSYVAQQCVLCQVTLAHRSRSHRVMAMRTDTQHHINIKNIIAERILPLEIRASHYICHPCWQRADRAAKHYTAPSTSMARASTSSQFKCSNCGIDITRLKRHILDNDRVLLRVQQRVAPQVVTSSDFICDTCHSLLINDDIIVSPEDANIGHQNICRECGRSVRHLRHHIVQDETHQSQSQEVHLSTVICHRCFQRTEAASRADSVSVRNPSEEQPLIVPQPTISEQPPIVPQPTILPNYSRAPYTHSQCIFPACNSTSQHVVPNSIRVRLFSDHKYYIPRNCRICNYHLESRSWSLLFEAENACHNFTPDQIEDFCELLKNDKLILDFQNIENMDDHLVWYWLGRSKEQFTEILAELPEFPKKSVALAAYLMKLRTGDSDERISTLLRCSRSTVRRLMNRARNEMIVHFVPQHLGFHHITRTQVAERNLYIHDSLFGNPGSAIEDRRAIVIMDGTYIYVQKSSNYSYQKKTYSLHKYRNLVKPFIIVCCDGYIIDTLGPYPATKSDADILKHEFEASNNEISQYFRNGDVFILDRGFRDCIPFLENLNYSVHYPLSVQQGETQMSTESANESRKVTLCRWVVEVVNGRFKRDYKLLRQEYFNKATNHLMDDFKVAAALINRFHPILTDRGDAREIVSIIQSRMFMNNSLAAFVDQNNLNRRRAQFESITVENNTFPDFPCIENNDLILIPLGIYQIKQARSYYGEHVRQDGRYIIEICREVDDELLQSLEMRNNNNVWLLRGKIRSRHISNKIYFVYILVDRNKTGRDSIAQYCCNCIVGRRTIGCCAHVMTIIWYLSWARHQVSITDPPAQFLNDILIDNIDDSPDWNG